MFENQTIPKTINTETVFKDFFAEKNLTNRIFKITHNEFLHIVELNTLINYIQNTTEEEAQTIAKTLILIDFKHGDLNHYLGFLAQAYIINNF